MKKLYRRCKQKLIADLKACPNPRYLDVVIYGVAYEFGMEIKDVERIHSLI